MLTGGSCNSGSWCILCRSFASVSSELLVCLKHLQVLEEHVGMLEESLPEWCVKEFEISMSESAHLEQLSMEMVARGCDLVAMDMVLQCGLEVQPHTLKTSEIVIRSLTRTLDSLRWAVCGDLACMHTLDGVTIQVVIITMH